MKTDYLTHDELQHIEHANKILQDHLELVEKVTNASESVLNTYVPILKGYVLAIHEIQVNLVTLVGEIHRSSHELKVITSGNQEIQNYVAAVLKLNAALDEKLIEKIKRLTND